MYDIIYLLFDYEGPIYQSFLVIKYLVLLFSIL